MCWYSEYSFTSQSAMGPERVSGHPSACPSWVPDRSFVMSFSTWYQKIRGGLDMVSVALAALDLIGQLASGKWGASKSRLERLELISKIVDRVKDGATGAAKPEDVRADIEKMRTELADNNATVDAEVDEKFPQD